jgi:hypothetical protein
VTIRTGSPSSIGVRHLVACLILIALAGSAAADEAPPQISDRRHLTGAATSWLGFGIGQGVQGRWRERGWIFTAIDAGTVVLAVAGFIELIEQCIDKSDGSSRACTGSALTEPGTRLIIPAVLLHVLSRFVQVGEAAIAPKRNASRPPIGKRLLAVTSLAGAGFVLGTTGLVAASEAKGQRDSARSGCTDDLKVCTPFGVTLAKDARSTAHLATGALAGSALAIGAVVYLIAKAPSDTNWQVMPVVSRSPGIVIGRTF